MLIVIRALIRQNITYVQNSALLVSVVWCYFQGQMSLNVWNSFEDFGFRNFLAISTVFNDCKTKNSPKIRYIDRLYFLGLYKAILLLRLLELITISREMGCDESVQSHIYPLILIGKSPFQPKTIIRTNVSWLPKERISYTILIV